MGFFLLLIGVCLAWAGQPGPVWAATWNVGDVFAGVASGRYNVYSNTGVFKETIFNGLGGFTTGGAFNPGATRLYTTDFSFNQVVVYDDPHPHPIVQNIIAGGNPESIVFAANGDFYVGHAGGDGDIKRYNAAGVFQQTYDVAIEDRGADWIDLARDQRTMFYTSEGGIIFRYDVSTSTQLPNFANIGGISYALRLLPPFDGTGGLIVANTSDVKRLNGAGAVVQTYDAPGENQWFAMNLDPNGTSFWAGSFDTNNFYRFNIATGAIEVGPIPSGGELFGLIVKGEITAAVPQDTTPPTCGSPTVITGPPTRVEVFVRDTGSGLASITVLSTTNASVTHDPFTVGTTAQVKVTATKINQGASSSFRIRVTDVAGNSVECDPVDLTVDRQTGKPASHTLTGIPHHEHLILVTNKNPGVTNLEIVVNGRKWQLGGLKNNEVRSLNVAAAMRPGTNNTIALTASGKPGGSVHVLVHD